MVNEQTWQHFNDIEMMPDEQSVYRNNYSAEAAIRASVNNMIEIINNDRCGILVMLDLSAAFDTVNHNLLLEDLKSIGIEDDVYSWFESYLYDREAVIKVFDATSQTRHLLRGVPQGSVLGPTLFNIYTAGLANVLKKHDVNFVLYGDDTQYCFPVKNVADAVDKNNEIMNDIRKWMVKKRL